MLSLKLEGDPAAKDSAGEATIEPNTIGAQQEEAIISGT
jgi:hypothetical protein